MALLGTNKNVALQNAPSKHIELPLLGASHFDLERGCVSACSLPGQSFKYQRCAYSTNDNPQIMFVAKTTVCCPDGLLRKRISSECSREILKPADCALASVNVNPTSYYRCCLNWVGRKWGRTDSTVLALPAVRPVPSETHDFEGFRPDLNRILNQT